MRSVLIGTAISIEKLLADGSVTMDTLFKTERAFMRMDQQLTYKGENKPIIFSFHYVVDPLKLREWLIEHKELRQFGPMMFNLLGICIQIAQLGKLAPEKEVSFTIRDADDRDVPIFPQHHPVVFYVYREVLHGQEWEVYVEEQS